MTQGSVDNLLQRADSLIDIDREQEALSLLQEAARLAPESPHVLNRFSRAYIGLKDWEQAHSFATRATAAAPDDEWAHRLRSISLRYLGKHEESMGAAVSALRLSPEDATCVRVLADAQLACGLYGPAEASCWRAVNLEPDSAESYEMLSRLYFRQSRWKDAIEYARSALERNPESETALYYLAEAICRSKGKRSALPYYAQILQNNPTNADAQKQILSYFTGFTYFVVPGLFILFCILLSLTGLNSIHTLVGAIATSILSSMLLFRLFPGGLLYPQRGFWEIPVQHREFIMRTWQREWLKRSGNTLVMSGVLFGLFAFLVISVIAIFCFPALVPMYYVCKYFGKKISVAKVTDRFSP